MWIRAVSLLARLGLAAVLLVSGSIKLRDPTQTVVAVRAYRLLAEELVRPVASALPVVEVLLGVLLLVGVAVRISAVASAVLFVSLIGAIASVWARGMSIDCGCFGGGGAAEVSGTDYAREIARDVGFLATALWLAAFPRAPLALGPGSRTRARPEISGAPQPTVAQ
ncbi:DoxX family membrane protein [Rhodococcus triatomae]|uniref:Methylamine utilisation protein MauE n=1 Tax=Rhodococcus triatomae TaxID=300028 RepID=A0A1G8F0M3_9NOCA|nr:MauE/DoxX family redox-associated membrane protein [Rhodococcus triatomae]QNG19351.1 DoxX family membrane protein [Rhodococcus triatomae]QNG24736.1 DoxX family membrane protein [Rhodococcus triatomae]SDH75701.1 Methylamine utilisation protein MauE [Rhodococcus triatomae]